jgi:hypothetical protein
MYGTLVHGMNGPLPGSCTIVLLGGSQEFINDGCCCTCPQGDYTVQVVARDETRAELMCVSVNFTLTMPSAANAAVAPGAATVSRAAAVAQARSALAELAAAAVTEAKQKQAVASSRRMAV